jgi:segregation and condensation protein B
VSKKDAKKEASIVPLWENGGDLVGALQAIFTVAGEVLTMKRLTELTGFSEGILEQGIADLQKRLVPPSGVQLVQVGGGWRMTTAPIYRDLMAKLATIIRSGRLTPAQIETLAIIAYRQPITITEINLIRGITSSSTQVEKLLEREFIEMKGRKPVVGRPMMYATTQKFLVNFGLNSLVDLPQLSDFGEDNLEATALDQIEPILQAQMTELKEESN